MIPILPDTLCFNSASGTASAVEVVLRGRLPDDLAGQPLLLKGPFCQKGRTLPAGFLMRPSAEGVWETSVVDPCFWTPSFPARYRLIVGGEPTRVGQTSFEVSLRCLEARRGHLWMDGRRWVFRGVVCRQVGGEHLPDFGEQLLGAVLPLEALDELTMSAATLHGVPLCVQLPADAGETEIMRAARCPAVQLLGLPADWPGERSLLDRLAPNLVTVGIGDGAELPAWADAQLCPAQPAALRITQRSSPVRPVLAVGTATRLADVPSPEIPQEARRACEQLQCELTPEFDLSGYIVK